MQLKNIASKPLIASILIGFSVAAIFLSVLASYQAKDAAMSAQTKTMVRVLEVAYDEMMTKLQLNTSDVAQGAQDNKAVRKLVKKANKKALTSDEMNDLQANLNDQFNQRFVTTGLLDLVKVRAFSKGLDFIAASSSGANDFPRDLASEVKEQALSRDKAEMKKSFTYLWSDDSGSYVSVLYPIGTFRIVGFIEATTNIAFNAKDIEQVLGAPIQIAHAATGDSLYKSEVWEGDTGSKLHIEFRPESESGVQLLSITLEEDIKEFLESLKSTQIQIIGFFIALGVIGVVLAMLLLRSNLFLPMKKLKDAMSSVTEGDLSVEIETLKRNDELGMMTNALIFFVHIFKENKQISLDASRVKFALQNSATGMLIMDERHHLIFANDCLKKSIKLHEADYRTVFDSSESLSLEGGDFLRQFQLLSSDEVERLTEAVERRVTAGERHLRLLLAPVFGTEGERVGTVIEWSDMTDEVLEQQAQEQRLADERKLAEENKRIRQSLDGVAIGVSILTETGMLAYANDSFESMHKTALGQVCGIGEFLPILNASDVEDLDQRVLSGFEQREVMVNQSVFLVTATPVEDEQGRLIGSTVEWIDKTNEAEVEKEIDALIQQAAKGVLTERIALDGKKGFFLAVSNQLNSLLEGVGASMEDAQKIMGALASGNLDMRVDN